jgi:hypothetical protein
MYLMQWGSYGTADGAFNAPTGITVDANGLIYVADTGNRRVQKFSPAGTLLAKWGTSGTGDGQFSTPTGVATDSWGNVWVADLTTRVQQFSPTGEYFSTCNTSGMTSDIAIDPSGTLYAIRQSGPLWNIGKYGTWYPLPTETLGHAGTLSITATRQITILTTTPAVPPPSQNAALPAPTVSPAPGLTTAPDASPGTIPAPTPADGYSAPVAAPGDQKAGDVGNTDIQKEILDRISIIFRYVFGVEI